MESADVGSTELNELSMRYVGMSAAFTLTSGVEPICCVVTTLSRDAKSSQCVDFR